jgi:hypothetical protein
VASLRSTVAIVRVSIAAVSVAVGLAVAACGGSGETFTVHTQYVEGGWSYVDSALERAAFVCRDDESNSVRVIVDGVPPGAMYPDGRPVKSVETFGCKDYLED